MSCIKETNDSDLVFEDILIIPILFVGFVGLRQKWLETLYTQFSKFTGPNGQFHTGHPSDWLERQVLRPPVLVGVAFTSPNDMRTNITVLYIPNTSLFNNPDIETLLSTDVNYLQRHNNATISKPIDCNTYKVADKRACIATVEMVGFDGTQFQRMALWTSIDGGIYALQFKDTKVDFNQTLPVFLQMLLTFQPK